MAADSRPEMPCFRGSLAQGQSQPDASGHCRPARSGLACQGRAESHRRSVRQLPSMPAGMPRCRRYSQAHDRSQGPICRQQRPGHGRLGADANGFGFVDLYEDYPNFLQNQSFGMMRDETHPSDFGASIWADELALQLGFTAAAISAV